MKRIIHSSILVLACLVVFAGTSVAAQTLSVQVRAGQLRAKPAFLAKVITLLPYGDSVRLDIEEGDWRKVTSLKTGISGWMHISALTDAEIVQTPTNHDVQMASQSSGIILAGSGFNKQVEEKYQERSKRDYSTVNAMEEDSVSTEDIQGFIKSGKLSKGNAK